jgi:aminodeoxyfutalosine deaminase
LIVHHAKRILPIAGPPIGDGWIAIDRGRVIGCGANQPPPGKRAAPPFESEPFAILPALVNAHTHLEFSCARGQVPPRDRFDDWVRTLVAFRRRHADASAPLIVHSARESIRESRASGTGLLGDISNTLVTVPLLAEAGMSACVFHELLGFNTPDADGLVRRAREQIDTLTTRTVRISLAPHAPYSVPPAMFHAIAQDLHEHPDDVSSVHIGESPEEVEFLRDGGGAIRAALEEFGAWNPWWTVPACGPLEYLNRMGLLTPRVLIVHAVQLTRPELEQVSAAGATLVTCPRSNRWTGAGVPPIADFYASGVRVAIGTDSLASVADLDVFNELAAVRALAPDVPAARILESATRVGAEALGFGTEFGTIEPGKRADLIAVRIPADVEDVEEYLLTGIEPADVRWIDGAGEPVSG